MNLCMAGFLLQRARAFHGRWCRVFEAHRRPCINSVSLKFTLGKEVDVVKKPLEKEVILQ